MKSVYVPMDELIACYMTAREVLCVTKDEILRFAFFLKNELNEMGYGVRVDQSFDILSERKDVFSIGNFGISAKSNEALNKEILDFLNIEKVKLFQLISRNFIKTKELDDIDDENNGE